MRKLVILLTLGATAWAEVTRSTVKVGRMAGGRIAHVTVSVVRTSGHISRRTASTAWRAAY